MSRGKEWAWTVQALRPIFLYEGDSFQCTWRLTNLAPQGRGEVGALALAYRVFGSRAEVLMLAAYADRYLDYLPIEGASAYGPLWPRESPPPAIPWAGASDSFHGGKVRNFTVTHARFQVPVSLPMYDAIVLQFTQADGTFGLDWVHHILRINTPEATVWPCQTEVVTETVRLD